MTDQIKLEAEELGAIQLAREETDRVLAALGEAVLHFEQVERALVRAKSRLDACRTEAVAGCQQRDRICTMIIERHDLIGDWQLNEELGILEHSVSGKGTGTP